MKNLSVLRPFFYLYPLLGILILITACQSKPKDKYTDTPTSGVVPVAVDESFEPIIQQEIDVFEGIYQLAGIVPAYTSEVDAITALLRDSVRLAITTRTLSAEEKAALASRKFYPREIQLAVDGIALIVNKQNKDTLITLSDLKRIMTGEITTWKELNKTSGLGELQLVFDNPNSSTVRFAIDSICRDKPLAKTLTAKNSNEGVIDYVAEVPNAIGVIGVSWLGEKSDSTRLTFLDRVRVMGVSRADVAAPANSYQPWQAYLSLGDYPLTRGVYALLTDPRGGLATGFATFMASDRGQRIILKSGIVPATQPVRIVNVKD